MIKNTTINDTYRPKRNHWWVGLGGTFDHFHAGHEHFLQFAARQGENLIIGVTSDHLIKGKPFASTIEPFRIRAKNVRNWCTKNGINHEIFMLDDVYGPTLEDTRIKALAVTQETTKGADKINEAREVSRMRPLPVYICTLLQDELGFPLHAQQIRAGLTNRKGIVYLGHLARGITLSDEQRKKLSEPLGELYSELDGDPRMAANPKDGDHEGHQAFEKFDTKSGKTVLVGDQTTQLFLDKGWKFDVAVYDSKIERRPLNEEQSQKITSYIEKTHPAVLKASNPAGQISSELVEAIWKYCGKDAQGNGGLNTHQNNQKKTLIQVDGEEDLATAAFILGLPLYSYIFYGQPGVGLVKVLVTETLKEKIFKILTQL